jgi:chromosome segregation ATPase
MIEKLSNDVLDKDDEIIELRKDLMKLRKDMETDELLNSEYEDYIKALEGDVASRDVDIANLKTTIEEANQTIGNMEKNLLRFKEKVGGLTEELDFYKQ